VLGNRSIAGCEPHVPFLTFAEVSENPPIRPSIGIPVLGARLSSERKYEWMSRWR
jgi:hypothetical protein